MLDPDGPQSTCRLTYVCVLYQPVGDAIQIFFKPLVKMLASLLLPLRHFEGSSSA